MKTIDKLKRPCLGCQERVNKQQIIVSTFCVLSLTKYSAVVSKSVYLTGLCNAGIKYLRRAKIAKLPKKHSEHFTDFLKPSIVAKHGNSLINFS